MVLEEVTKPVSNHRGSMMLPIKVGVVGAYEHDVF